MDDDEFWSRRPTFMDNCKMSDSVGDGRLAYNNLQNGIYC